MVLSDRTIARFLEEGRIEIDPYDDSLLQPSSVDVRVDRYLPGFPQQPLPLHRRSRGAGGPDRARRGRGRTRPSSSIPGEFVLGSTLERIRLPDDLVARLEGKSSPRPARPPDPLDRRLHRPGLGRPRDARALERREPPGDDLPRDEDRPDLLRPAHRAGGDAVRDRRDRLEVPGPARADPVEVLAELPEGTGRLILVTGGTRLRGRPRRPRAARPRPARALPRPRSA